MHPPQEPMRPILFCSRDLSKHEKWMDYPCDVIFKMASVKLVNVRFRYNSASRIDRDKILVSALMFLKMENPMMILTIR